MHLTNIIAVAAVKTKPKTTRTIIIAAEVGVVEEVFSVVYYYSFLGAI
jgi:hypothetical protein